MNNKYKHIKSLQDYPKFIGNSKFFLLNAIHFHFDIEVMYQLFTFTGITLQ